MVLHCGGFAIYHFLMHISRSKDRESKKNRSRVYVVRTGDQPELLKPRPSAVVGRLDAASNPSERRMIRLMTASLSL